MRRFTNDKKTKGQPIPRANQYQEKNNKAGPPQKTIENMKNSGS